MDATAGWSIWGRSGERMRKFVVATPDEETAIRILKSTNPDLEMVSRHSMSASTIKFLGMSSGQIVEQASADMKTPIVPGGTPIDQPVK